eukprot:gene786-837_t
MTWLVLLACLCAPIPVLTSGVNAIEVESVEIPICVDDNCTIVQQSDYVGIEITGRFEDGTEFFDSRAVDDGGPIEFRVGDNSTYGPWLDAAVDGAVVGEKRIIKIPGDIVFGHTQLGLVDADLTNRTLFFEIEILHTAAVKSFLRNHYRVIGPLFGLAVLVALAKIKGLSLTDPRVLLFFLAKTLFWKAVFWGGLYYTYYYGGAIDEEDGS